MESLRFFPVVTCILALALPASRALKGQGPPAQEGVNPDALIIQNFENRVSEYAKLHRAIDAKMPALKPTDSSGKITHHQQELAEGIRKARRGAKQGDIFTPQIHAEFHPLITIAMQGQDAARIHTSLRHAEPVRLRLRINAGYPASVPLQSTPPSLLLNLPKLPEEIEYRVVGNNLVLCDAHANLIIDFMPGAIP
ncbi:MAG: hypothetical protein A3J28_15785 [Acidobacteria bacterium RIFCSPLOWO2_12_FULL_60_22]|nr:MAG: hypothetical protein A3J28_15785 [Acidobacteria bacterium RIFCSPLOWO2_12_FULL_60_22]